MSFDTEKAHWYCLRSKAKNEHIAAAELKTQGFKVFLPRIRYNRSSKYRAYAVTEPLFPSYVFARFSLETNLKQVTYCRGVRNVIRFGETYATIPDDVINDISEWSGPEAIVDVLRELESGVRVKILNGSLKGWEGILSQYQPAAVRARVLLEFLGRQSEIQLNANDLVPVQKIFMPKRILGRPH